MNDCINSGLHFSFSDQNFYFRFVVMFIYLFIYLFTCSWWTIIIHMCWTVLGVSHDFDLTTSVDVPSETITRFLYAGFFIMGVILLINMLIALLSNTYQRIQVHNRENHLYYSIQGKTTAC